jgi:hypothetical protein
MWVSKNLSAQHKDQRLKISRKHLARYRREEDGILQRIISADETWMHHNEPEGKDQRLVWKHESSLEDKKLKHQ